ncbi:MAG: alpha-E domain-containing protein [Chthonomonadaceae bacterium]|nr:alpha-E domain-containing protein [Chthonomonadaceae bacterium]
MLCRDADACYWIGRYVERAEATARMVDVHYHAALDSGMSYNVEDVPPGETEPPIHWASLLKISGSDEDFYARYESETDRDIIQFFAFDLKNPHSILSTWNRARDNARSIREQIASEMWESINIFYLELREWNVDRVLEGSPHEFFERVKRSSHLFQGILNRTMLMSETRDWLDVGRFLERGDQTARLLDVKYHDLLPAYRAIEENAHPAVEPLGVGSQLDIHGWIAVLKSVSAFEMYRKVYPAGLRSASVVDFLVLNPQFPASVRHCVKRVDGCLTRIGDGPKESETAMEPQRLIMRLMADLQYVRPGSIIKSGLHEFLEDIQVQCADLGDSITKTYLSY